MKLEKKYQIYQPKIKCKDRESHFYKNQRCTPLEIDFRKPSQNPNFLYMRFSENAQIFVGDINCIRRQLHKKLEKSWNSVEESTIWYPGHIGFSIAWMAPNTINAQLTFQCHPSYWISDMPWVHDVSFQEIFKKYEWPEEKQNGNKKKTMKTN